MPRRGFWPGCGGNGWRARVAGTPLGAICSAACLWAKAGFLTDVETSLHWAWHDLFTEEFPEVRLVHDVFVAREWIITASGGTAAADLMLHQIGKAHGEDLAIEVADQRVYNAVRQGSAAQRVPVQSRHGMRNEHLKHTIAMMEGAIESPMSPSLIAEEPGISSRQLERLNRAQNLLVQSDWR